MKSRVYDARSMKAKCPFISTETDAFCCYFLLYWYNLFCSAFIGDRRSGRTLNANQAKLLILPSSS